MPSKKPEPSMVEVVVSYSAGVKASIARFESASLHLSETERWSVEGLGDEDIEHLRTERYELLKERVDSRIEDFYRDNSENC